MLPKEVHCLAQGADVTNVSICRFPKTVTRMQHTTAAIVQAGTRKSKRLENIWEVLAHLVKLETCMDRLGELDFQKKVLPGKWWFVNAQNPIKDYKAYKETDNIKLNWKKEIKFQEPTLEKCRSMSWLTLKELK